MMPLAAAEAPIVDAHAHVFLADMPLSRAAWFRPGYAFTAEQYLEVLDAHGIHFGVIAGISIYGLYNDYMLEQLRKHRRLRGTANLLPTTERYVLERMKQEGVVGVRLQLTRRTALPDIGDEEHQLLLRRLADLDMHVQVVVEGRQWPALLPKLEASGVKIVIDHFGHPDPAEGINCAGFQAILRSAEKGRTWVKLSGAYRLTWAAPGQPSRDPATGPLAREIAQALLRNVGPERLLWGSDCPFVGHESHVSFQDTLDELAQWAPDAATRRKLSDTALKLYFG
ncbi:MAG: amidohydrolase family protein [Steroidobacteraceae bacterium]